MMYMTLPNGQPTSRLRTLLPNIINPEALTDAELDTHGVARVTITKPAVEWWQTHDEPVTDLTVRPVTITYPVIDRTLEDAQLVAWERIKDEREVRQSGFMSYVFDTVEEHIEFTQRAKDDLNAQVTVALVMQAFSLPGNLVWTTHENITHQLTPAEMQMLGAAAGQWQAAIHVQSQTIREGIVAAQTVEAVVAAAAWPE